MLSNLSSGYIRRPLALVAILVLGLLVSCSGGNTPTSPDVDRNMDSPIFDDMNSDHGNFTYAPGEVLVVLNEETHTGEMLGWAASYQLLHLQTQDVPWGPLYRLKLMDDEIVTDVCDRLNEDPRVRFAEPNYVVTFDEAPYVPNDPLWERSDPGDDPRDSVYDQWGPAKSGAPIIWNETKGSEDVIVAVLDTGVMFTHEDLYYQLWYNMDEITGNGTDDDNNGFVDDWLGWNFNEDNNNIWDDGAFAYYHGSACSGIVGAEQDNGKGLTGIAPGVKIMGLKLNLRGWPESAFINSVVGGLHYAKDNGAHVASMSFGSTSWSDAMNEACEYAYDGGNGMVLMASAGNSDSSQAHYPASYDSVIAVAAVCAFNEQNNRQEERRITSSEGWSWGSTWGDQLEISGYGDKYTTTYGGHYSGYWDGYSDPDFFGGTSCACPMTAGVMALIKTYFPDENASWLRDRIKYTSDDIHGVGWDDQSGYGRANAVRAVYGPDRYSDMEDADGFVPINISEGMYHDSIHDVPGNPYEDSEDLYIVNVIKGGLLQIELYITNWGEDLDIAVYSDAAMTDLIAESVIDNDPYNNIESIEVGVGAGVSYLKVYSPADGNSSLYDLTINVDSLFDVIGTDIAPVSASASGEIPLLKLDFTTGVTATIESVGVSLMGTLPLADINSVKIYIDTDISGDFTPGDGLVSEFVSPMMNRTRFDGLGVTVTAVNPVTLFVVADINVTPGLKTLGASIESYKEIVTIEGFEAAYTNFPMRSALTDVGS